MCQRKPGLRCAAHTRESYEKAIQQFNMDQSATNYSRLCEAENAYFKTPEGIQAFQEQMRTMPPDAIPVAQERLQRYQREINLRNTVTQMIKDSPGQVAFYPEASMNQPQAITALRNQLDEQINNQLLTWEERQPDELDTDYLFIDVEDDTPMITDQEFLERIRPTVDRLAALEKAKLSV